MRMRLKKFLITSGLLFATSIAFATPQPAAAVATAAKNQEIAASVIAVKQLVIDNQMTRNGRTEVFMELINIGNKTHRLIAATCPLATQVQLHMTTTENGRAAMRQVHSIDIKVHTEKDLVLGGLHIMLIGLKRHLVKNNKVPITLVFSDGSWETVLAEVS